MSTECQKGAGLLSVRDLKPVITECQKGASLLSVRDLKPVQGPDKVPNKSHVWQKNNMCYHIVLNSLELFGEIKLEV